MERGAAITNHFRAVHTSPAESLSDRYHAHNRMLAIEHTPRNAGENLISDSSYREPNPSQRTHDHGWILRQNIFDHRELPRVSYQPHIPQSSHSFIPVQQQRLDYTWPLNHELPRTRYPSDGPSTSASVDSPDPSKTDSRLHKTEEFDPDLNGSTHPST